MNKYLYLLLAAIFSCQSTSPSQEDTRDSIANETTTSNFMEGEKQRIKALIEGFSKPLEERKAMPSAESAGASYATGYKVLGENVSAMVYIYKNQQEHQAAMKFFETQVQPSMKNTIMASNGSLFFWGYTETEDPAAEYVLNDLVSAFAGEE